MKLFERKRKNSTIVSRYLAAVEGESIELLLPPVSPSRGGSKSSHRTAKTAATGSTSTPNVSQDITTPGSLRKGESGSSPRAQRRKSHSASHASHRTTSAAAANDHHAAASAADHRRLRHLPRQRLFHQTNPNQSHSEDDSSSLTSRRTSSTYSKAQQQPDPSCHPRSSYHRDDEDFTASSTESNTELEYAYQRQYDSPEPQPRPTTNFNEAMEKGIDMILNTNAWACAAPHQASPSPTLDSTTVREGQHQQHTGRNTFSNRFKAAAAAQSSKQHHRRTTPSTLKQSQAKEDDDDDDDDELKLKTSFSSSAKSDWTGIETEIAGNRGVDVAMKRIQEMESRVQQTKAAIQSNTRALRSTVRENPGGTGVVGGSAPFDGVTRPQHQREQQRHNIPKKSYNRPRDHQLIPSINGEEENGITPDDSDVQSNGHRSFTKLPDSDVGVKSDWTGVSTQVATNRAMDLARRRIYDMESQVQQAKSAMGRNRQRGDTPGVEGGSVVPSRQAVQQNDSVQRRKNKLGNHVVMQSSRVKTRAQALDDQSKSVSSIGVEISRPHDRSRSNLRSIIDANRSTPGQPHASDELEKEVLTRPPTVRRSDLSEPRSEMESLADSSSVLGSNLVKADLGPTQKRTFLMGNVEHEHSKSKFKMDSTHPCYETSPDPIFCSKSFSVQESSVAASGEVSFDSEDALFMEQQAEGSCSTAMDPLADRSSQLECERRTAVVSPQHDIVESGKSVGEQSLEKSLASEKSGRLGIQRLIPLARNMPHPSLAIPFGIHSRPSKKIGEKRSLSAKICGEALSEGLKLEESSVDVKSLRSAFESLNAQKRSDAIDSDDDNGSVKSLKERYEVPVKRDCDQNISKARAVFSAKKHPSSNRFAAADSNVKELFTKFEANSANRTHARAQMRAASQKTVRSETIPPACVLEEEPKTEKSLSVSERIEEPKVKKSLAVSESNHAPECIPEEKPNVEKSLSVSERIHALGLTRVNTEGARPAIAKQQMLDTSDGSFISELKVAQLQLENRRRILSPQERIKKLNLLSDEKEQTLSNFKTKISEAEAKCVGHGIQQLGEYQNNAIHEHEPSVRSSESSHIATAPIEHNQTEESLSADAQHAVITSRARKALDRNFEDILPDYKVPRKIPQQKTSWMVHRERILSHGRLKNRKKLTKIGENSDNEGTNVTETLNVFKSTPLLVKSSDVNKGAEENEELVKEGRKDAFKRSDHRPPMSPLSSKDDGRHARVRTQLYSERIKQVPVDVHRSKDSESKGESSSKIYEASPTCTGVAVDNLERDPCSVVRQNVEKSDPIQSLLRVPTKALSLASLQSTHEPPEVPETTAQAESTQQAPEPNSVANAISVQAIESTFEDTLALPNLVSGIVEQSETASIAAFSDADSSEYSDGVTLDVSIADVSILTYPTALVSRADAAMSVQSSDCDSSDDEQRSDKLRTHRNVGVEEEAKRSEASSSQPSEAAAPLIAKAMRVMPMSDELSTDSFFRTRAHIAKQFWKVESATCRRETPTISKSFVKTAEEEKTCDPGFSWDVRHVEAIFPLSSVIESKKSFESKSDWNPFPVSQAKLFDTRKKVDERSISPSRSKTPIRENTRRRTQEKNEGKVSPLDFVPFTQEHVSAHEKIQPPLELRRLVAPHAKRHNASEPGAIYTRPLLKRIAETLPSTYAQSDTNFGKTNFGPKHSALLARLKSLKEARLRRAAAMVGTSPGSLLHRSLKQSEQVYDDQSCSTMSSTMFGGSTFLANLEVD